MRKYKLTYFNVRNLAEASRMVLTYAGEEFEDVRLTTDEWPAVKHKYPHGKMPVLEFDGKILAQSQAIARFLARKYGLAGDNDWERAKVDEILDFQKDVYNAFAPYFYHRVGFHPGDQDTLRKEFLVNAQKYLPLYVKLLELSKSGFFMESGVAVADFWVADYLNTLRGFEPEVFAEYPPLEKFVNRVYNLPQLKKYISKRSKEFPI